MRRFWQAGFPRSQETRQFPLTEAVSILKTKKKKKRPKECYKNYRTIKTFTLSELLLFTCTSAGEVNCISLILCAYVCVCDL